MAAGDRADVSIGDFASMLGTLREALGGGLPLVSFGPLRVLSHNIRPGIACGTGNPEADGCASIEQFLCLTMRI